MEFTGDEKRIRVLFSELSLEDRNHAPHFEKLWRRAEANASVPLVRRFALAFVTTAILAGVCLVATWTWYRASQSEQAANIPPQIIPTTSDARISQPEHSLSASSKELRPVHPRRVVRPRQTGNAAIRGAELLSKWQSPTSILLDAPTVSVLGSLPQLNQSARDLEQFLPNNNEVLKESKQ
jgi:hypothetical protein